MRTIVLLIIEAVLIFAMVYLVVSAVTGPDRVVTPPQRRTPPATPQCNPLTEVCTSSITSPLSPYAGGK